MNSVRQPRPPGTRVAGRSGTGIVVMEGSPSGSNTSTWPAAVKTLPSASTATSRLPSSANSRGLESAPSAPTSKAPRLPAPSPRRRRRRPRRRRARRCCFRIRLGRAPTPSATRKCGLGAPGRRRSRAHRTSRRCTRKRDGLLARDRRHARDDLQILGTPLGIERQHRSRPRHHEQTPAAITPARPAQSGCHSPAQPPTRQRASGRCSASAHRRSRRSRRGRPSHHR